MADKVKAKPHKNIYVSDEIYDKLSAMRHPGQSFGGLLQEMMDKLEKNGDKTEVKEEK